METTDIRLKPRFAKDKDRIWAECFAGIADEPATKTVSLPLRAWGRVAAAVMVLLTTALGYCYMHTTEVYAPNGSHQSLTLPDGSTVALNAGTRLCYKPYWWIVNRNVYLDGEACFEVQKGRRFTVTCGSVGEVRVLGTSFNVFARGEALRVSCLTGKVRVTVAYTTTLLTPGMKTELHDGRLRTTTMSDVSETVGWKSDRFIFYGVPLSEVIKEMERQYDICIRPTAGSRDCLYTGKFTKPDNPEDILEIIGRPFGLNLEIVR